jgi:alpha-amylase/alpha-mannosidase (GH57 family)
MAERRFVCLHGHFYQPPRENPWTGTCDREESAYPFHDWNERIASECYAANLAAPILDEEGRIRRRMNVYEDISFNFGATLLSWMDRHAPEVLEGIRQADRAGVWRHAGHGPAIAQAYGHAILPLASCRDREIQIRWGLADFRRRFGRPAEGMWLPETAVDTPTLEALAAAGVLFTILAPHQIVPDDGAESGRRPFLIRLPSGRSIAAFAYDGPLSHGIAFGGLLRSAHSVTESFRNGFRDSSRAELVHAAVDGETFGHHHRFADMAIARALEEFERAPDVTLTTYGEFLAEFPARDEGTLVGNTSWSCVHGIERWRSSCGCGNDPHPSWSQNWREPLRAALNALRDRVRPALDGLERRLFAEPELAVDQALELLDAESELEKEDFLGRHLRGSGSAFDLDTVANILRLERQLQLMFASCGWFFDDVAGLEARLVIRHAASAIDLARSIPGIDAENEFRETLAEAVSNDPNAGTGRDVYDAIVRDNATHLSGAAAMARIPG